MFETAKQTARTLIALTYTDGRKETVSVRLGLTAKLADALNGGDAFLDVINAADRQYFVAKTSILRVELVDVPKTSQMNMQRRAGDRDRFDPWEILGIPEGTPAEAIRSAYHAKIKAYHPDRLAGIDLPKEMKDYAAAMVVRINLAYEQIGA
jgi:hypothetical protein